MDKYVKLVEQENKQVVSEDTEAAPVALKKSKSLTNAIKALNGPEFGPFRASIEICEIT